MSELLLSRAFKPILRVLARIALRGGVSYQQFSALAREQFVDVAENEFALEGRKQTNLRVATLTGLSRKAVAETKHGLANPDEAPSIPRNRAAQVLVAWQQDAQFLDYQGRPRDLPRSGENLSLIHI